MVLNQYWNLLDVLTVQYLQKALAIDKIAICGSLQSANLVLHDHEDHAGLLARFVLQSVVVGVTGRAAEEPGEGSVPGRSGVRSHGLFSPQFVGCLHTRYYNIDLFIKDMLAWAMGWVY